MAAKYCPKCGKKQNVNNKYCFNCGTELGKDNETSKKYLNKCNLIFLGGLIGCAAVLAGISMKFTGSNHKKTDDMISDGRDQTNSGESISEEQSTSTDKTSDSAVYTNAISIDSVIQQRGFHDDLAFLMFRSEYQNYKGFIDKNGNMRFFIPCDNYSENVYTYDVSFDNGYTWAQYNGKFYVIDTDGTIKSQYDANEVVNYGGGFTWLEREKNVSWDNAGVNTYTLYDPEGNEVYQYEIKKEYFGNWSFDIAYMKNGVFLFDMLDANGSEKNIVYDTKHLEATELDADIDRFINRGTNDSTIAALSCPNESVGADYVNNPLRLMLIKDGKVEKKSIPSNYFGMWGSYPGLLDWSDQYALLTYYDGDINHFFVYDIQNKKFKEYSGKYKNYLQAYTGAGNAVDGHMMALRITGADGGSYVCLVDANGTMPEIGDPIRAEDYILEKGLLIVDNTDVYDMNQKKIFSIPESETVSEVGDDTLFLVIKGEDEYGEEKDTYVYRSFDGTIICPELTAYESRQLVECAEAE